MTVAALRRLLEKVDPHAIVTFWEGSLLCKGADDRQWIIHPDGSDLPTPAPEGFLPR